MKQAKYASYCCNVHINKVHIPNVFPCKFCIEHGKTQCYHHEVCIKTLWQQYQTEHDNMTDEYPYLSHLPVHGSQLHLSESVAGASEADAWNISFVPETCAAKLNFSAFLGNELFMHGASMDGSLEK